MINDYLYYPLEKKIITKHQRFKISPKELNELKKNFKNKIILITGAAGSIGSQFCKDIFNFKLRPKKLILLDKDENQLTELNRNLLSYKNYNKTNVEFFCVDLNIINLDEYLSSRKIQFYLNFAALKHVRTEENFESLRYMFLTNSINCIPNKINFLEKIFIISTDKTVNPSSILGISKYLMEVNLSKFIKRKIFMSSVRFANVSFSNGSILKYVTDKILEKKIFGIPKNTRRFFITHEEASSLCFKSLLKRNNKKITVPSPKVLKRDYLISDLTKKIVKEFGYKVKFHKNKSTINKNYDSYCNILLTRLSMGQKDHEQIVAENEKVFKNIDKTINTVEFPKKIKNFKIIINKIIKSKNSLELKYSLERYFKNYHSQNRNVKVSNTI